ncbi:MAG: sporulation protein YunB [Firmicutes bacterium]|nr:sporulation protein YunB [Bacillota bacterium]
MKIRLKGNCRFSKAFTFLSFVSAFFASLLLLFLFLIFRFKPVFQEKAEYAAKSKANAILNSAVADVFNGINTDKFVNIITGADNSITSITTNTGELNRIKTQVYKCLKSYSAKSSETTVYIPIGSLTDYPVLQGLGYKIPVKILFDTALEIDFADSLKDAGINQVYYEISVVAVANLDVVSALMTSETAVETKIPISQTLIVGTVPESYGYEIARR